MLMSKILLLLFSALLACGQLRAQIINRCLDFDPTTPSDYVQTTSSPVTGNSNFTVEARFFCTSTGSNTRRLFAFGGGANNRFEISESGGALRFTRQVVGGSITTSNITSPNVRDDAWHHLAATRNGATVRVYLDGVQVYTTAGFAGVLNTTTFRIGASVLSVGATFHWDGRIDEVRVWDVERTAAEIEEFRLFWVPCTATGLKAYYRFDQGTEGGDNTGLTVLEDCNDQINGLVTDFALTGSNSNWVLSNDAAFTSALRCAANFTFAQQDCGVVNFTNTTVGTFSYSWAFGDGGTSTQTNPSHTYTTSGTYTVTLTITDLLGSCSAQKTVAVVVDNVPPTMSCKSKFVDFNTGQSGYTLLVSDILQSATDNCCAANLLTYSILSDSNFTCADACPPTPRTVTLMATDCNGNTGTCTAQVLTRDLTPPIAVCKNVNVGIGPSGTFTIAANAVDGGSTDNCVPLTLAVTPSTFGCPMQGCEEVHVVTLQATDCAGSTSTCTAQVTVRDVIGPVFVNCPSGGNLIVSDLPPNECAIPNFFTVPATDNCDMTLDMNFEMTGATNISGPGNGEGEPLFTGFTTISYLANDDCGNTSTCSFTVFVQDQERPMINCPPNMTVTGSLADGGAVVNWSAATATDNCFNVALTSSAPNGSFFDCTLAGSGPSSVVYTATDASGNTATCVFTIKVECIDDLACQCGSFSNLSFGPKGGKTLLLDCGETYTVPCPVAGTSFEVKGDFACVGNCTPSNVTWEIKNSSGMSVASGMMATSPFTLAVAGSAMSTPGTYMLTMGADCGITGCARCVVGLVVVDCPTNPCIDTLVCGDAVVTCYSGLLYGSDVVAAVKKIQNAHNMPSGTDLSGSLPPGKMWTKSELGEVFGLAIDNTRGDAYFTSTTVYGTTGAGPNGYGGVYKIEGCGLNVDPTWNVGLPNSVGPAMAYGTTLNHAPGLGNICYDQWNDQLLVTNFEDGKIYRITPAGVVQPLPHDPFSDNGQPGFAPLGKRCWGIGVTRNSSGVVEVYYGVWAEDYGRRNASAYNSVRRVELTNTGSFDTSTDVEVIPLSALSNENYSCPISDIAFSQSGDLMILAERSMSDDIGSYAHQSRVLKYKKSGSTWVLDQALPVGSIASGNNSAGGVDFGQYFTATNDLLKCDTSIWCTADYIDAVSGLHYGMQGFYKDQVVINTANSWIVDFNGAAYGGKTLIGDVEILKCPDCPVIEPCESISAVPVPTQDSRCCHDIFIGNQQANLFSSVNIQVVSGGSMLIDNVTIGSDWEMQSFVTGLSVTVKPTGGGTIPSGTSLCARICLDMLTASPQVIAVDYLDAQGKVLCTDTLSLQCDFCIDITQDTITCIDGGLQQLTFCIEAADNLGYSIQSVVLTPQQSGVTFTPKAFTIFPPLAPGDPCRTLTTTVDLGTSGLAGELCYTVTVHEADITKGIPPLRCCMIDQCTKLPDCLCDSTITYATFQRAVPLAEGLCCYNITLHQPAGEFVSVETEVISVGSTLSGVGSDLDWDGSFITPKDVLWMPDPISTLPAVTTLPTLCFGGEAPQVLEITWMTEDSMICTDRLQFNCTDSACAVFHPGSMDCVVFGGSAVTFQFEVTNLSGLTANHVALVNISPAGVITGQTVFPIPDLLDGAPTATLMTTLNNSVGTEACFQVNLYYKNPNDSLDIKDCCLTDTLCFTMPRCTMENAIQPIIIFPNPTRDAVTVYFGEGAPANGLLRVRDLTGRLLHAEALPAGANAHQTSVSAYPPGLYFIEVVEGERRIWSGKVARQGWD